MGKTKTKQEIDILVRAFINARFDGQNNTSVLSRKSEGNKTQPLAALIDTETEFGLLEVALNAAIVRDPDYKSGEISIKHLGGSAIPVFLAAFNEVNLVFRLLPKGPYITSYKDLQEGQTKEHLPKQYFFNKLKYRDKTYHLEVIECCDKGSLELQARNNAELLKNKQQLLLSYSINILQIMIDFKAVGIVFPDIKPSNFLVTNDGRIVIADIKTLLDIRDKTSVLKGEVMNTPIYESGSGLMRASQGLAKSESFGSVRSKTISIDEIELKSRYMVGVTLYELATGQMVAIALAEKQKIAFNLREEAKYHYDQIQKNGTAGEIARAKTEYDTKEDEYQRLSKKRPHDEMSFELDVFKKEVGSTLKKIIQSFINADRSRRMSFEAALKQLCALKGALLLLRPRKSSYEAIASSSASADGNIAMPSSSQVVAEDERQSPKVKKRKDNFVEKKRGIFQKDRTVSVSTVIDKKIKDVPAEPEAPQPATSRESLSPSKKKIEFTVKRPTEEESSSVRVKKGYSEEKKRTIFQRNRTASSPVVVDPRVTKSEETSSSEVLPRFSMFKDLISPRKSSKASLSPRIATPSSSSEEVTHSIEEESSSTGKSIPRDNFFKEERAVRQQAKDLSKEPEVPHSSQTPSSSSQ
ncbi:protein kinase family protein [Legionella fallonii]|uniref:non-specific serine/threonine protein kinase n=1 Tax=Legionella fallonii LLAP-10 TaxID=1212491 RepID=A0A098FZT0_9GAMM|nr:hypothetical protein [Legionella fallonii]CEG55738.1 Serine/threonine-protein kinase [Legionella fallonii LLAP-10]